MFIQPLAQDEPEGIFFSRISIEFHAYWRCLAQRRGGVPLRSDLEPADIPRLLPFLFLVEKTEATGRFFFRLSGTGLRDRPDERRVGKGCVRSCRFLWSPNHKNKKNK